MSKHAVVVSEFDIASDDRERFGAWHSREHIKERIDAGLCEAERYVDLGNPLHYLCLYRAQEAELFWSEAYAAFAKNPSLLTQEITRKVKGTRFVGEIGYDVGVGRAGFLTRVRVTALGADAAGKLQALAERLLASGTLTRVSVATPRADAPNADDKTTIAILEGIDPGVLSRALAEVAEIMGTAQTPVQIFQLEHMITAA